MNKFKINRDGPQEYSFNNRNLKLWKFWSTVQMPPRSGKSVMMSMSMHHDDMMDAGGGLIGRLRCHDRINSLEDKIANLESMVDEIRSSDKLWRMEISRATNDIMAGIAVSNQFRQGSAEHDWFDL